MLLKLDNIGKIYNSNEILTIGIRNINLEFDYNEFVTIEGESGSGKSTLLNVIAANDTYEEGNLYFDGEETKHYSDIDWQKYRENNIAMIFQDFNIIENLTVYENIELALLRIEDKKVRHDKIINLIKQVGLLERKNQKTSKLSGGEKQRCVIARALAKDSPIILADEPTGNLDVKTSKEIARLLKEVSVDKLVIVVTHNPEFFAEYATRRVIIRDGSVLEDKHIVDIEKKEIKREEIHVSKKQSIKNTFKIGVLNYKSRPKFSLIMSLALATISIALLCVVAMFNKYLISPLQRSLDDIGIEGKVIISNTKGNIDSDVLDKICYDTKAGYFMLERDKSEFSITIPKKNNMYKSYTIDCLYDPYHYNVDANEGILVMPQSYKDDAADIISILKNANGLIYDIEVKTSSSLSDPRLYLSYDLMENHGTTIKSINSNMKISNNSSTVYYFEENKELENGVVNLVNSSFYDVLDKNVIFDIAPTKIFKVGNDTKTDSFVSGIVVEMSSNDYNEIFNTNGNSKQACIYFESNEDAYNALDKLPDGYIGMISTSMVYVENASDVYIQNVLCYSSIILLSLLLAAILYMIFSKSINVFLSSFSIYKTLGISNKVSSSSLYVQNILIFLPTLILLPIVSFIFTNSKTLALPFISIGNYIFIEALILLIVILVTYGFNKSITKSKITESLRRGSK